MEINGVFIDNIVGKRIPDWKKDVLKKDDDKTFVIDGREGAGKSVFAMQLAKVLDPNFNLDKVCFNSDQFIQTIKSPDRKKGDCIVLDEAFSAANARASLSSINRAMIGVATEMRQLNLFVIICLPTYFDLDRYFAIWRCDTLFHIYKDKKGNRGRFIIFPFHTKKNLYLKGKKAYNYNVVKSPYPPCRFNKGYVVDEMEYRRKKAEAFRERKVSTIDQRYKERLIKLIKAVRENFKVPDQWIADKIEVHQTTVNTLGKEDISKSLGTNILGTTLKDNLLEVVPKSSA